MMKKPVLIMVGVGATLGLAGCGYAVHLNRKRDTKAGEFVNDLDARLNPASKGIDTNKGLDMSYHEEFDGVDKLTEDEAKEKAWTIYDAWGKSWYNNDNETQVYSTFRSLKNPAQISQVAEAYYNEVTKKKITLLDDIKDRMDDDEVEEVMSIINEIESNWNKKK